MGGEYLQSDRKLDLQLRANRLPVSSTKVLKIKTRTDAFVFLGIEAYGSIRWVNTL